MLLSAVSALAVAQSSWEIPEGLMNNPVHGEPTPVQQETLSWHIMHDAGENNYIWGQNQSEKLPEWKHGKSLVQ